MTVHSFWTKVSVPKVSHCFDLLCVLIFTDFWTTAVSSDFCTVNLLSGRKTYPIHPSRILFICEYSQCICINEVLLCLIFHTHTHTHTHIHIKMQRTSHHHHNKSPPYKCLTLIISEHRTKNAYTDVRAQVLKPHCNRNCLGWWELYRG